MPPQTWHVAHFGRTQNSGAHLCWCLLRIRDISYFFSGQTHLHNSFEIFSSFSLTLDMYEWYHLSLHKCCSSWMMLENVIIISSLLLPIVTILYPVVWLRYEIWGRSRVLAPSMDGEQRDNALVTSQSCSGSRSDRTCDMTLIWQQTSHNIILVNTHLVIAHK